MKGALDKGRLLTAAAIAVGLLGTTSAESADLQPRTIAAFDRYVKAAETETAAGVEFLRLDGLPAALRRARQDELRAGMLHIERLTTLDGGSEIPVPDGLMHHWVGTVFAPGASVEQALSILQDYDKHAEIYRPAVVQSRLLSRNGDRFRMFLRFSMTKVITVVVNTEHDAQFYRDGPDRRGAGSTALALPRSRMPANRTNGNSLSGATVAICGGSTPTGVCCSAMAAPTCSASRFR